MLNEKTLRICYKKRPFPNTAARFPKGRFFIPFAMSDISESLEPRNNYTY